ncbi:MAG: SNF2-related protein, partial [Chitinispirillaceae bacterium]
MKTLSQLASGHFESHIRLRGEIIHVSGSMQPLSLSGKRVKTVVYGTKAYNVQLHLNNEKLTVSCDCPYFERTDLCKHIWAVIMRAEEEGYLTPEPHIRSLEIIESVSDEFEEDIGDKPPADPGAALHTSASWKELLGSELTPAWKRGPQRRTYFYYLNIQKSLASNSIAINIRTRLIYDDGQNFDTNEFHYDPNEYSICEHQTDKLVITALMAANNSYYSCLSGTQHLKNFHAGIVVPLMAQTGRLYIEDSTADNRGPLYFDSTNHKFEISLEKLANGDYELIRKVTRNNEAVDLEQMALFSIHSILIMQKYVARIDLDGYSAEMVKNFLSTESIPVPRNELHEFLDTLYKSRDLRISLPGELQPQQTEITPVPCAILSEAVQYATPTFFIDLYFDYEGTRVRGGDEGKAVYNPTTHKVYPVNTSFHFACATKLQEAGAKWRNVYTEHGPRFTVTRKKLLGLIQKLLSSGWIVEGEEGAFKTPGNFSFSVTSGIDWFDLEADCSYDEQMVKLPELLAAAKKGDPFIKLADGSLGMLPREWLEKFAAMARMGESQEGAVRFKRSQALIIDMLLEDQPEVSCDETFAKIRREMTDFQGIRTEKPPSTFRGELRPYQKEGLGWFRFLQKFGLGGCLADDMGLGKTVQVLALLEARRKERNWRSKSENIPPVSLVVAPRSVIYNWIQETHRFAPSIEILDYSNPEIRGQNEIDFSSYDLVTVTYGTLRRDIEELRKIQFDYVILDEAQAVKNRATVTAKAVRLLQAKHRLALSGTPVENHLSDIWSIFEFLNPGMLGGAGAFKSVQASMRSADEQTCAFLRRILRPFILRRTKAQVAVDLPERTEEVIVCDMEPLQRKRYDELRDYYRATLLAKVEVEGMNKSRFHVLEALLRLRQAACHPGLVRSQHQNSASVKIDTLLAQIDELRQEGHKCLVFSQFTSFLDIVRSQFKKKKIDYEYLDGSTRNRKKHVDRFQDDPECSVFLISLKAGGTGLNLTAAEYVFILDPWWNPAVEAQAIDRAHRIGQTRPVFAYKLICRDTVEEKVLELQKKKRKLAESIISGD